MRIGSFLSALAVGLGFPLIVAAQPYGLNERVTVSGVQFPLNDPGAPGTVRVVRAFPSVTFSQPVFVTHSPDGTNRLFIVEKPGRIKVITNSDSSASAPVFLDISGRVNQGGEQGLLGLAFDPDYATNGYFYVYYSANSGAARSVISRFRVTSNPSVADANSESVVIEVPQPSFSNHKAGMIAFGPDGMLYIALGDGGDGGDPSNTGQNCADMLGAILRIDPRGATPYRIPSDNPYGGSGRYSCGTLSNALSRSCGTSGYATGEICKELFAYGLRNPWRFSFDRVTGALWAGDVGQGALEEVDIVRSGSNMGWVLFEGNRTYRNPTNIPLASTNAPIITYDRTLGYSISGGYVYRGSLLPSLYGKYIYADYGSGRIWALDYDGTNVVSNSEFASLSTIVSFGEDRDGELYGISIGNGTINRFLPPVSGGPTIPATLSATGVFANTASLTPNPGAIEFDVQAPLWSDGAAKRRWLLLPGTQRVTFHATEAFAFPVGTALVKHFELPLGGGVSRRLETRVLFRHQEGWAGYTYKWRADGSDADLLPSSLRESYTVQDASAPGGTRQQEWYYPSRTDCMNCHTASAGRILGVRTRQLNRNFNYPGTSDNQLRSWNHIGLFSTDIGAHTGYGSYPAYTDGSVPVETRARAYLAVNCSNCHQPAEARPGVIDLRYDTPLASTGLVNERPLYGSLDLPDAFRIKPGAPGSSVLLERMKRLDSNRMPPLASGLVDPTAASLIRDWITVLGGGQPAVPPAAPSQLRVTQ